MARATILAALVALLAVHGASASNDTTVVTDCNAIQTIYTNGVNAASAACNDTEAICTHCYGNYTAMSIYCDSMLGDQEDVDRTQMDLRSARNCSFLGDYSVVATCTAYKNQTATIANSCGGGGGENHQYCANILTDFAKTFNETATQCQAYADKQDHEGYCSSCYGNLANGSLACQYYGHGIDSPFGDFSGAAACSGQIRNETMHLCEQIFHEVNSTGENCKNLGGQGQGGGDSECLAELYGPKFDDWEWQNAAGHCQHAIWESRACSNCTVMAQKYGDKCESVSEKCKNDPQIQNVCSQKNKDMIDAGEGRCACAGKSTCDSCTADDQCKWTALGCYDEKSWAMFPKDEWLKCTWTAETCYEPCKILMAPGDSMKEEYETYKVGKSSEIFWINQEMRLYSNIAELIATEMAECEADPESCEDDDDDDEGDEEGDDEDNEDKDGGGGRRLLSSPAQYTENCTDLLNVIKPLFDVYGDACEEEQHLCTGCYNATGAVHLACGSMHGDHDAIAEINMNFSYAPQCSFFTENNLTGSCQDVQKTADILQSACNGSHGGNHSGPPGGNHSGPPGRNHSGGGSGGVPPAGAAGKKKQLANGKCPMVPLAKMMLNPPKQAAKELTADQKMMARAMSYIGQYSVDFTFGTIDMSDEGGDDEGDDHGGDDEGDDKGGDDEGDDHGGDDDDGGDDMLMLLEGCVMHAFQADKVDTCPDDCRLNYCFAQKDEKTAADFKTYLGECAHNKLVSSCGCADLSEQDLLALGTPGPEGLNPPPVPKIGTVFASGGKGSNAGGPLAIKGAGADLYFLSLMEIDASAGSYDYKEGADAINIIQEIELDAMTLSMKEAEAGLFDEPKETCDEDGFCERAPYPHGYAYFKMATTKSNTISFEFHLRCAVSSKDEAFTVDGRGYAVSPETAKCDVEISGFPFKGGNSYLVIKTATMGVSFTDDLADEEGEGEDTITIGGVKAEFAKTVISGDAQCAKSSGTSDCDAKPTPVKGTQFTNCGTVKWYTKALAGFTQRYFGFSELKCNYWTFQKVASVDTYFLWDPKLTIDKEKAIENAIAQKQLKTGKAGPAIKKKPEVKAPPKLKANETIAGVEKPTAPKAGKPIVKAKVAMTLKKYDAKTANSIKASFAKTLGKGVSADKVKITKATFDVKSEMKFPKATKETFPVKTFKKALATDMKVDESQVTVVVKDARRHLLAGVTVETAITGIEQFEQAEQITKATESTSAVASLPAMKEVTATAGAPAVTKAPAVEAQFEFEIETDNADVAKSVTEKLGDANTAANLATELKSQGVETQVKVKKVETIAPPASSAKPAASSSVLKIEPSSAKLEESAAGARTLLVAVLATVAALLLC